ncbi:MAG: hypothetical protein KBA26_03630 [Candidatus Delongbacteria bacterium]|nr:hypothetical protein [Candidatus Delongbacteria bacterium]
MKHLIIVGLVGILVLHSLSFGAVPKHQRGDRKYRKEGIHNGNLVETIFYNFGEVGWWGRQPSGVWPRGSNHPYMDGITPLVVAQVSNQQGNTISICEAGYRELMDISPEGIERGWQPRPGYANPFQDKIAMSDNPGSWPSSWPDKDSDWDGYWNGYFGKRTNADQESYFVVDDDSDDGQEFYPDTTDLTRRGLGLKMGVRGFQWSNTLAEDLIFWHYDITNEGTSTYQKIIFGMYVDVGVGGQYDSNDDNASFELADDITYSWDSNNLGEGGWGPTGWCGYAFLESPGNPFNRIDDDGDGESGSPTITPTMILGEIPDNGIDDNHNGLIDEAELHLGFKYADGIDNDGNGVVDEMIDERRDDLIDNDMDWNNERDDVGADGLAGTGDTGEGDGRPTSGEPNFDATDKDESDQIGLTAFDVFYIGSGVSFQKDDEIWSRVSYSHFDTQLQNGNIAFLYGSGLFPLKPMLTERFSVCLVFGENLEDIKRNKQIVQDVYNNNYNFARPPEKPKVKAIAGNGFVTLYWDDRAEKSYDLFSNPPEDFEGYKIYRSTDPGFLDARIITNAFGEKTFLQPVAQFDLENEVEGFFPLDYQGIKVYMGENKGLRHSWTDRDVMNGKTYYYAVVSYDRGDVSLNMYPSECSRVVVRDVNGNVSLDDNTVEVTPSVPAAGYIAAGLTDSLRRVGGFGTGSIWIDVLDPNQVKEAQTYRLVFDDTTLQDSVSYSLINITQPEQPVKIFEHSFFCRGEDFNPLFDGMRLMVYNDSIAWDGLGSGWTQGQSNLSVTVDKLYRFDRRRPGYPSGYEIRFGPSDTSWWFVPRFKVNFQVWDLYENQKVLFALEEPNAATRDSAVSPGDYIRIIIKEGSTPREVWRVNFLAPLSGEEPVLPNEGDCLQIKIKTPFRSGDCFEFTSRAGRVDPVRGSAGMDSIAVVPNPYLAAARWEPSRLYATGRGERRLFFIHLPSDCTIRIYTVSGDLVQTLQHHSGMLDGSESWDLKTKDGLDAAPGIYLFHVDAGSMGEKIGRFAIIK